MYGLAKIADTNLAQDLWAGFDPLGTKAFTNAKQNEEDHKKHQMTTATGGFLGGSLIGTLAPAALLGATGMVTRRFNPTLAHEFKTMGKGTLDALSPSAMSRHLRAIKPLTDYKKSGGEFLNDMKHLSSMADDVGKGAPLNPNRLQAGMQSAKDVAQKQKQLEKMESNLSQKYYQGAPVTDGASRTFTALSTAGAGVLSGGMGAISANNQYKAGLNSKPENEQPIT